MGKRIFDLSGIITIDGLQNAVKGLKEISSQFAATEKAFYKFGRQIGSAGSKLTQSITIPVVAAAGAATLAAKSFGDFADSILDMSKATGLTTDTVQEMKQVASDAGTDFQEFLEVIYNVTKSMPQLQKGQGAISQAFRQLGINALDANGKFRNMNDLFPEIVKKLQNVKSETEKTALAQMIFGKRFEGSLDIINMSNEAFDESRKKAHDLGVVLSGEALKAADDFRVSLADATNQLVAMGRGALLELLPVFKDSIFPLFRDSIIPALKDMGEKVATVAKWFNNLDDGLKKNILSLVGIAAVAGPVLIIMSKMIGAISGVASAVKIMQSAFIAFSAVASANPLGLAIAGVVALGVAIGTVVALFKTAKKLKEEKANNKNIVDERAELEKLNREWRDRLTWLEKQVNPTAVMVEEMASLREGIKGINEELGHIAGVPVAGSSSGKSSSDLEEKKLRAIEAEKRKQEEIAKINAEYAERHWQAQLRTDEERYQHEKELELIRVKEAGGDVALAAEVLDAEHQNKLREAADREIKIKQETADETVKIQKKSMQDVLDIIDNYIGMVGNIGSGIAGIFQQSTSNKQMALDNQQQAERDAIENSLISEREKRKAIEALDKKQDKEQRDMRRKSAAESKRISIFESIMATASAVVNALGSAMPPLNFIYAGIVGAIGAAKTALISAQPLPLAAGGIVKRRSGGIMAQIAEGSEDEAVIPLKTGVRALAQNLLSLMRESFTPMVPAPFAMAGGGGYGPMQENHWHIGVLVADDNGIKELERRQLSIRNQEAQRKGQI